MFPQLCPPFDQHRPGIALQSVCNIWKTLIVLSSVGEFMPPSKQHISRARVFLVNYALQKKKISVVSLSIENFGKKQYLLLFFEITLCFLQLHI